MFHVMNSMNKHAKKDLRLAYSQGNMTAYPPNIKAIARYLSTQYSNNNLFNQRNGKEGDKNKGDDPKSNGKDSNTSDTADAQVGDTTITEESTAPSRGASIGAHVLETNVQFSCPSRTVEEILGAHPMSDIDFWGGTNPGDVSIDTTDSEEMMTGSQITESHTHKHTHTHTHTHTQIKKSVPPELLNKVPNVLQVFCGRR